MSGLRLQLGGSARLVLAGLAILAASLLPAPPVQASDTVYYYSSDSLHSEVVITDQNRNVVERTHYAPYGQVLDRSLRDGPGYTGHAEDPGTGLVYMQQRYYDPVAGRFLSADPVQADPRSGANFNRYWYANDNPYRYTDPDGRWADTDLSAGQGTRSYAADVMAHPDRPLTPIDKVIVAVGAAAAAASGLGEVVAIAKSAATADKALSNGAAVTRYMGPEEAKVAARTGEIPNVGKDGIPRPTHVTKDAPLDSAAKAQARYELPTAPTHRATVPANRATDLGRTPDGRATTSGGGSQNATNHPIPVKPEEIKRLDH